ncbi:hypothetical protein BD410DRAFT_302949 [Rickenella mellea]|uniref:Uncharacterized protein n=1 Tax=Rickenella mellea TaxID=50990 RepID=A0A4Y7Q147_9AGAM|nr:hypothetical protein BD410DRAFT_302949 [Rickenella mellea]
MSVGFKLRRLARTQVTSKAETVRLTNIFAFRLRIDDFVTDIFIIASVLSKADPPQLFESSGACPCVIPRPCTASNRYKSPRRPVIPLQMELGSSGGEARHQTRMRGRRTD